MSEPRPIESAIPIKDDDDGNPSWWGMEWDAACDYENELLSLKNPPRDDVRDLSLRSAAIAEMASQKPDELTADGLVLAQAEILEIVAWGEAARDAWHKGDVAFFNECRRLLAFYVGERDGKKRQNDVPLAVTIIKTARELAFRHQRHPTKMEVQEAVEKLTDNDGNPLIPNPGTFRWEWSRWHLSFLPGKSDVTK